MKMITTISVVLATASSLSAFGRTMNAYFDDFSEIQMFAEHWKVEDPNVIRSDGKQVLFNGKSKMTLRKAQPKDASVEGKVELKSGKAEFKNENGTIVFYVDGEGTMDDVRVTVPVDDNASPNLIINSGFEYSSDGVPPYFCNRAGFNWSEGTAEMYEKDFLTAFVCDSSEKHSGKQSLRLHLCPATQHLGFYPHDTPTDKGLKGVFTAWMKTSVPGTKVRMKVGGAAPKVFELTKEWSRYEVASSDLPGRGLFSPVSIEFPEPSRQNSYVWIDDLQFEFTGDDLKATEYRPSDMDIPRFIDKKKRSRPEPTVLKKLPAGVKPTIELEKWIGHASESTPFLDHLKKPYRETRAWLACDDDNLYVAYRNYGEDAKLMNHKKATYESTQMCTRDSVEIGFQPTKDPKHYHFFAAANGDCADYYNEDGHWNGTWTCKARDVGEAVEYLVTFPLEEIARKGFSGRWYVNLERNDRHDEHQACVSTILSESARFRDTDAWGELVFPADVAAKFAKVAAANAPRRQPKVLGRLDYYMNEPEARFRVWNEEGKVKEVAVDISALPYGSSDVAVEAFGRKFPATVVKRPYKKNATQVNYWTRSLVHNGEKVLMVSNCLVIREYPKNKKTGRFLPIDLMHDRGFRYGHICSFSDRNVVMMAFEAIKQGGELGMDFMNWTDDKDGKTISRAETQKIMDACENIVSQVVTDEPDLYRPSDETRDFLRENKKRYPYTPVQMNNSLMGIASRYADLETDILMLDDYLTNNEGRTVEGVIKQVDVMLEIDDRKPAWYFLVGENAMHHRTPTYAEQIAQCWGCLCTGGSGVTWFVNMPTSKPTWDAMIDFNREAQSVKEELLSEELSGKAVCSEPWEKVRFVTRKVGDVWYVFSCNIDADPVKDVTFTMPEDAPKNGKVEVLFENRALALKDGVFNDSYPAHFRHVYKITR